DCPEHMFRCKHGPCIARAYICDGEVDCPLREDEHNCTGSSTNTTVKVTSCDAGMVLCADHTACFPKHWVCDGARYQCTCAPGYRLGDDRHSCRLERDNEGKLFIAMGHEVSSRLLSFIFPCLTTYVKIKSLSLTEIFKFIVFFLINTNRIPSFRQFPLMGFCVWFEKILLALDRSQSTGLAETFTLLSGVRVLVGNKLDYPTGISIDLIRGDVYFGDVEREMIERVNMDTRERASSSLKVAELRLHHGSAYLIHSFAGLPYGLAINHSIYQPATSSIPCALNDCQWMCVSIPDIEGNLEAKCLCPDGYDRSANGDCLPLSDSTTTDPDGSSLKDEDLDLSHVGVAWMKERCDDGDGCLNGGHCEDIKNEYGRVTKIVCKCESPYEGYRCERLNPIKERAEQLSGSSRPHWLALFVTFMLLILLVLILIFAYRHIDLVSKASQTVTSLVERRVRRIPSSLPQVRHFIESMKTWVSSKLTTASERSSSSIFRTEFSNPLFSDDPCNSLEEPRNELAYSNPMFDDDTHAAPFSGINVTYTNKF
ncbi:hypothetical protein Angca_008989, partial [Angiostrongylus cantonensis]